MGFVSKQWCFGPSAKDFCKRRYSDDCSLSKSLGGHLGTRTAQGSTSTTSRGVGVLDISCGGSYRRDANNVIGSRWYAMLMPVHIKVVN